MDSLVMFNVLNDLTFFNALDNQSGNAYQYLRDYIC